MFGDFLIRDFSSKNIDGYLCKSAEKRTFLRCHGQKCPLRRRRFRRFLTKLAVIVFFVRKFLHFPLYTEITYQKFLKEEKQMLTYEQFKDTIIDEILTFLPEEYSDCTVSIEKTLKNNGMLMDGLLIKSDKFNVSPNIYLNGLYEEYESGRPIKSILRTIANIRVNSNYRHNVDPEKILNFNNVRDFVNITLVNYERNRDLLKDRPHRRIMDLAVIYYVDVVGSGIMKVNIPGSLSMAITNDLMTNYDLTEEMLFKIAMRNMCDQKDYEMRYIHEDVIEKKAKLVALAENVDERYAIKEVSESFEDWNYDIMYLTNRRHDRGAALMLREDLMEQLAEKLDGSFYIIPSSIHEVIVVSEHAQITEDSMTELLHQMNSEMDDEKEYLSDSIYFYDAEKSSVKLVA